MTDYINHPPHYDGEYECITAMIQCFGKEAVKDFCLCNAFKYIWRCKLKHDDPAEDMGKAMWYLNKYKELNKE